MLKSLYFNNRLFLAVAGNVLLFILAFLYPSILAIAKLALCVVVICLIFDLLMLYNAKKGVVAKRICPDKLSNGDQNEIRIWIENFYRFKISARIIDEVPVQFQNRDVDFRAKIISGQSSLISYKLRPVKRGEYTFGALNIYVRAPIGFAARRFKVDAGKKVPVYPSFLQLRKFELAAISARLSDYGIKKIRKLGQSTEFEQIRDYVQGDDIRTINWKASGKRNELMVNQFMAERSQHVYSVIDKGRLMKMPFNGLSLMDYAINASLVISNVAIKKHDKGGIISFSHKMSSFLKASNKADQMAKILHQLYRQKTLYKEPSYATLTASLRHRLSQRSLVLLYTNFESLAGMQRQLKFFKLIAKRHLLVVVFFKNTELFELAAKKASNLEEIYGKTIAQKFSYEKELIVKELKRHGIQSILTKPEDLTINTINKYLEIKARQLL